MVSLFLPVFAFVAIALASAMAGAQAQSTSLKSDQSWTATTQTGSANNSGPSQTTETYSKSGNRVIDKKTVEVPGFDGGYQSYDSTETETVQESGTTSRSTARSYSPGLNGQMQLIQEIEEDKQSLPNGTASVVRTTSTPDDRGHLHIVQSQVSQTTSAGRGLQDTETTVYMPDVSGAFAPAIETREQQKQQANGVIELTKTTNFPDGNGGWRVGELTQQTIKNDGQNRSTEEMISRPDYDGKLTPVSRIVVEESQVDGQTVKTIDTYSIDVPGLARDDRLHLIQHQTNAQKENPMRTQTRVQIQQSDWGSPSREELQTLEKISDTVVSGASASERTRTNSAQDLNGNFNVESEETTKSGHISMQVQMSPADQPK